MTQTHRRSFVIGCRIGGRSRLHGSSALLPRPIHFFSFSILFTGFFFGFIGFHCILMNFRGLFFFLLGCTKPFSVFFFKSCTRFRWWLIKKNQISFSFRFQWSGSSFRQRNFWNEPSIRWRKRESDWWGRQPNNNKKKDHLKIMIDGEGSCWEKNKIG